MESFEYNSQPARVIFGSGSIQKLPAEISRLGLSTPLALTTPGQVGHAEHIERILGGKIAGSFTKATMHTPVEVTEEAMKHLSNADSIVSIGGGSTIGLGKALSIRSGLPHICIPTTYAGSEMTPILGESQDGRKTTRSDPKILPGTVIYDVDLTLSLPASLSAASGVNAIAHAVEALYAQNTNPIINLLAADGIRSLAASLPTIAATPSDAAARSHAQYGAWLCGTCLGNVGMALHHKLCHTLGGSFNLPHAETHAAVLPHALAYNAPAVPAAMRRLAEALPHSDGDAVRGLNLLLERLGVKRSLADFGFGEEDIDRAAELAVANPYWNPRQIEKEKIREVIRRCWAGEPAKADL